MDSDKLNKINKALKIAVNLVKPDQAGFEALLEAKDIVEKELKNPSKPTPPPPSKPYSYGFGDACRNIRNHKSCKDRFSARSSWCDLCVLGDMFRY